MAHLPGIPEITRNLRRGLEGPDVGRWQIYLWTAVNIGATHPMPRPGKVDGVFGPATEAATKWVQRSLDMDDDGVVGELTLGEAMINGLERLSYLGAPMHFEEADFVPQFGPGDTGLATRWWQVVLCTQDLHPFSVTGEGGNPQVAINGVFDASTVTQTKAFQARHGLVADGIVGRQTQTKAFQLGALDIGIADVNVFE